MNMYKKYAVLFVCTGNICRSPTADGLLRYRLGKEGLDGRVISDSAGTHDYHIGSCPDARSIEAAQARGICIKDLRARQLRPQDFHDFNLVLAMDRGHMQIMKRLMPADAKAESLMFMDFAPEFGIRDVPDPYYGGSDGFERVLDMVESGVEGILNHIRDKIL